MSIETFVKNLKDERAECVRRRSQAATPQERGGTDQTHKRDRQSHREGHKSGGARMSIFNGLSAHADHREQDYRFSRSLPRGASLEPSAAPFMLARLVRALVWAWDLLVDPLEDRW